MSASNRKIHRLPDRVFEDLITRPTTTSTPMKAVPLMMMVGDKNEEKKIVKKTTTEKENEKQTKNKENSKNKNEYGSSSVLKHDDGTMEDDETAAGATNPCTSTGADKITANGNNNPSLLRQQICHRLQRVPVRYVTGGRFFSRRIRDRDHHHHHRQQYHHHNHNSTNTATTTTTTTKTTTTLKIETVGELFMLSKYTLLLVLDPILTYGACDHKCKISSI